MEARAITGNVFIFGNEENLKREGRLTVDFWPELW